MPRHARSVTSKTSISIALAAGLPEACTARGYAFSISCLPDSSCSTVRRMPSRMSSGSKPVTTIGSRTSSRAARTRRQPITVQTWPAARKRLHPVVGRLQDRGRWPAAPARARPAARSSRCPPLGLIDRHRVGGCRGFEPDREEHHLLVGILPRDLQGVERRVHDAHVAARGLDLEQILLAARDAQHVAERTEDHVGSRRDLAVPCRSAPAA